MVKTYVLAWEVLGKEEMGDEEVLVDVYGVFQLCKIHVNERLF